MNINSGCQRRVGQVHFDCSIISAADAATALAALPNPQTQNLLHPILAQVTQNDIGSPGARMVQKAHNGPRAQNVP